MLALTDGTRLEVLPAVEDHKTIFDGDRGPNTGGMGTVSPAWITDPVIAADHATRSSQPTVRGLAADGIDYRGVLYAGVMVDPAGDAVAARVQLPVRRSRDPADHGADARRPRRGAARRRAAARCRSARSRGMRGSRCASWSPPPAIPSAPRTGDPIGGLDRAFDDVVVFHAGTARKDGAVVSAGGRVLGVTALGVSVEQARGKAYAAVDRIDLPGKQVRRDIGARGARAVVRSPPCRTSLGYVECSPNRASSPR